MKVIAPYSYNLLFFVLLYIILTNRIMTEIKNMEQMPPMVMARAVEWDSTTYVPAMKVNIIAITETVLSTVDARSSFDTRLGSSAIDEMIVQEPTHLLP